jgi:hypothetical protein
MAALPTHARRLLSLMAGQLRGVSKVLSKDGVTAEHRWPPGLAVC